MTQAVDKSIPLVIVLFRPLSDVSLSAEFQKIIASSLPCNIEELCDKIFVDSLIL